MERSAMVAAVANAAARRVSRPARHLPAPAAAPPRRLARNAVVLASTAAAVVTRAPRPRAHPAPAAAPLRPPRASPALPVSRSPS